MGKNKNPTVSLPQGLYAKNQHFGILTVIREVSVADYLAGHL